MKGDLAYLKHIRDAVVSIEDYVRGVTKANFLDKSKDRKTKDAVVRQFEIIGEAVGRLSEDIKSQHPSLPWKRVINMRNKLIHEYFAVDLAVVWKTIEEDLPFLKEVVDKLLLKLAV